MSDHAASRELVLTLYDLRLENNEYAIRQVCSPDLHFELMGQGSDRIVDHIKGDPDAIRHAFEYITSHWHWVRQDIHDIVCDGNTYAVRYTVTMDYLPLSRRVVMDIADFVTIENGLVTKIVEFLDTATIYALMEEAASLQQQSPLRASV